MIWRTGKKVKVWTCTSEKFRRIWFSCKFKSCKYKSYTVSWRLSSIFCLELATCMNIVCTCIPFCNSKYAWPRSIQSKCLVFTVKNLFLLKNKHRDCSSSWFWNFSSHITVLSSVRFQGGLFELWNLRHNGSNPAGSSRV